MPWSNQGGGGGPWGQGPGGPQPPNLEELLRQGQERFKGLLPGGQWGGRGIILIILIAVAVWGFSGFYRVQPDEQGVVLRFGAYYKTTQPGLNYHLPSPIETVFTPKVTRVNRIDIGFRGAGDLSRQTAIRDVPAESLMLTGDENIIDIDFAVFWVIKDAGEYLFNIEAQQDTVKAVAESAMREVIGKSKLQTALTGGREPIEQATKELMQKVLDNYKAGVLVTQVKMQKVDPPAAVIDAFRDVQAAKADLERQVNEAQAYSNDILPRARGEAQKITQGAEAYKQQVIAEAQGEAQRFIDVNKEYSMAKDVTARRLYLETMEEVLRNSDKVIIDSGAGSSGVVPYLPLPELKKREATR